MKEFFRKIFVSQLFYFIIAVFALWYVFPYIPVHKLTDAIPKDFAYHNLSVGIVMVGCIILSAVLNMFAQFGLVYSLSKLKFDWKKLVCVFLGSAVMLILCIVWIEHYLSVTRPQIFPPSQTYFMHLLAIGKNIGSKFIVSLPQRGFINFFIITLCFSFGSLLSYIIKEKNLLVPVMLCCAFIDIWTCTIGFVSKTLAKAPEVVSGVSTGVSMIGGSKFALPNIATIGPGDFIFASLVFACVMRFALNGKRNFWFMFSFLTLGMLLIVLGILPFLPALVCVCLGTLLANFRDFDMNRQEKLSVAVVFAVLLLVYLYFKFFRS